MVISSVIFTNRYSIDRVLNTGLPVLLLFASADNQIDRELSETLESLAAQYAGRALIARVNAAEEPELAQRFAVSALPALVVANRGERLETLHPALGGEARLWLRHLLEGGTRPQRVDATPSAAPPATPVVLTDSSFNAAIADSRPTLVDFWAPWCGPCRMVAPSVERLAREYAGRATVAKLNVDENQSTAMRFGIRGIPALLIFKNGQVVEELVGAQPYDVLNSRLTRHV